MCGLKNIKVTMASYYPCLPVVSIIIEFTVKSWSEFDIVPRKIQLNIQFFSHSLLTFIIVMVMLQYLGKLSLFH